MIVYAYYIYTTKSGGLVIGVVLFFRFTRGGFRVVIGFGSNLDHFV
jgi:hypothetical protein